MSTYNDKVELFTPSLGVISIFHRAGRMASVCSTNQIHLYQKHGWEVGGFMNLLDTEESCGVNP